MISEWADKHKLISCNEVQREQQQRPCGQLHPSAGEHREAQYHFRQASQHGQRQTERVQPRHAQRAGREVFFQLDAEAYRVVSLDKPADDESSPDQDLANAQENTQPTILHGANLTRNVQSRIYYRPDRI